MPIPRASFASLHKATDTQSFPRFGLAQKDAAPERVQGFGHQFAGLAAQVLPEAGVGLCDT